MILKVSSVDAEQYVAMWVWWCVRLYGRGWIGLYRDLFVIFGRTIVWVWLYPDFPILFSSPVAWVRLCSDLAVVFGGTAASAPIPRPRSGFSGDAVMARHVTWRCWIGSGYGSMRVWHVWAYWW
jgi:hypothetical protein